MALRPCRSAARVAAVIQHYTASDCSTTLRALPAAPPTVLYSLPPIFAVVVDGQGKKGGSTCMSLWIILPMSIRAVDIPIPVQACMARVWFGMKILYHLLASQFVV